MANQGLLQPDGRILLQKMTDFLGTKKRSVMEQVISYPRSTIDLLQEACVSISKNWE